MAGRARPTLVFVSYASRDRRLAEELRRELEARGLRAWTPDARISLGENWAAAVAQALEKADALVFLVSPEWVKSPWTPHEVGMAVSGSRFAQRVFPVIVRPTADYPWILRRMHPVRVPKGTSHRKAAGNVAQKIATRLRQPPAEAASTVSSS